MCRAAMHGAAGGGHARGAGRRGVARAAARRARRPGRGARLHARHLSCARNICSMLCVPGVSFVIVPSLNK